MQKLKIAFFHVGSPCHGKTKLSKPLGGTESALLDMAEALATLGHELYVFTILDEVGDFKGVSYHPFQTFESFTHENHLDVFISIRQLLPVLVRRWAPCQIYFSPDAYDQPFLQRAFSVVLSESTKKIQVGLYSLRFVQQYIDKIFCVGKWQINTFIQSQQLKPKKTFLANNGVTLNQIQNPPIDTRLKRIVYASTPFRGLEFLLDYFPELKMRHPDLECWVMSGMQLYGMSSEEDQKQYGAIYKKATQPGVKLLGPISKPELYKIFSQSLLMAYPNTFPETFCISVLEAQAAGLPVVTTKLAGLEERIQNELQGYLVDGHPSETEYKNKFIDSIHSILIDQVKWTQMNVEARKTAAEFEYVKLAKDWEKCFYEVLGETQYVKNELFQPSDEAFVFENKNLKISKELIVEYLKENLKAFGFNQTANSYLI